MFRPVLSRAKVALSRPVYRLVNLSNLVRTRLRSAPGARGKSGLHGNFRVRENVQARTFARESRLGHGAAGWSI